MLQTESINYTKQFTVRSPVGTTELGISRHVYSAVESLNKSSRTLANIFLTLTLAGRVQSGFHASARCNNSDHTAPAPLDVMRTR